MHKYAVNLQLDHQRRCHLQGSLFIFILLQPQHMLGGGGRGNLLTVHKSSLCHITDGTRRSSSNWRSGSLRFPDRLIRWIGCTPGLFLRELAIKRSSSRRLSARSAEGEPMHLTHICPSDGTRYVPFGAGSASRSNECYINEPH